jgi:hypothetical protein
MEAAYARKKYLRVNEESGRAQVAGASDPREENDKGTRDTSFHMSTLLSPVHPCAD